MKSVTVTVTRKHYTAANKSAAADQPRSRTCLVAQALKGIFPEAEVWVRFTTAQVEDKDGALRTFKLSATGQRLISKYDTHQLKAKNFPVTFRMTERATSIWEQISMKACAACKKCKV